MLMHGWLQIGDASGSHSPLSFGGFGSMLRHLRRLHQGIHAALQQDALDVGTLKGLQVKAGLFLDQRQLARSAVLHPGT